MGDLAPITPKLARLIPRLASDKDGEVIATARAIGRQLARAGADWHDLAQRLTAAPEALEDAGPHVFSDYRAAVRWILEHDAGELTERDRDFCRDMARILTRWPPRPKQARWIRGLVERLGGRFDSGQHAER